MERVKTYQNSAGAVNSTDDFCLRDVSDNSPIEKQKTAVGGVTAGPVPVLAIEAQVLVELRQRQNPRPNTI
jgi:hypothetical protein